MPSTPARMSRKVSIRGAEIPVHDRVQHTVRAEIRAALPHAPLFDNKAAPNFGTDLLVAVESIEAFVQGMSFEEFRADDKTARAVIRKFEIIGEATKQIPDSIHRQYPEIPWKDMAGMRNGLIHFYFGVDYQLVWAAIKPALAPFERRIVKGSKRSDVRGKTEMKNVPFLIESGFSVPAGYPTSRKHNERQCLPKYL